MEGTKDATKEVEEGSRTPKGEDPAYYPELDWIYGKKWEVEGGDFDDPAVEEAYYDCDEVWLDLCCMGGVEADVGGGLEGVMDGIEDEDEEYSAEEYGEESPPRGNELPDEGDLSVEELPYYQTSRESVEEESSSNPSEDESSSDESSLGESPDEDKPK